MFAKPKRWSSKKYTDIVKEFPCMKCGRPAEPHHIKGTGNLSGGGLKAPDWATMPLCHEHHMEMHGKDADLQSQWEMIARTLGGAIECGKLIVK